MTKEKIYKVEARNDIIDYVLAASVSHAFNKFRMVHGHSPRIIIEAKSEYSYNY